jgi:hypothetical protein
MREKRDIGFACRLGLLVVPVLFAALPLAAQMPPPGGREPPPQAYDDCRGKKAGDAIMHTTPEGKVAATCVDSPKGLFARPNQPPNRPPPPGAPRN